MSDIFVSYASEDRDRVAPLVDALLDCGWTVWWDRELRTGVRFEREIADAIDAASCVVVVWSQNSVASDWVATEAGEGLERRILVPVQIEDVKPPLIYRRLHTTNLVDWPSDPAGPEFDRLLLSIRGLVGDPKPSQTANNSAGSIAVLPFATSGSEELTAFGDGLAEDVLNGLCQLQGLVVKARTSSFRFRDGGVSVQAIGEQLDAAYVLEGTVRASGSRVRVTAQLIHAAMETHIWSERFDRELTDVFEVQDEIAESILAALGLQLRGAAAPDVAVPSVDRGARDLVREGEQHLADGNIEAAVASYRGALRQDRAYPHAMVALADALLDLEGSGPESGDQLQEAASLLDRAESLGYAGAELQSARGLLLSKQGRQDAAVAAYETALRINPNEPSTHGRYAWLLHQMGNSEQALERLHAGLVTDPLSLSLHLQLSELLEHFGRFEEAHHFLEKASTIDPANAYVAWRLGEFEWLVYGRVEEAIERVERSLAQFQEPEGFALLSRLLMVAGRRDEARIAYESATDPDQAAAGEATIRAMYWFAVIDGEGKRRSDAASRLLGSGARSFELIEGLRQQAVSAPDPGPALAAAVAQIALDSDSVGAYRVRHTNLADALLVAACLEVQGAAEDARRVLNEVLRLCDSLPRMGRHGFGVVDAIAHAMLGEYSAALVALREAATAGWRVPLELWLEHMPEAPHFRALEEFDEVIALFEPGVDHQADAAVYRERLLLDMVRTGSLALHVEWDSPAGIRIRARRNGRLHTWEPPGPELQQPLIAAFKEWVGLPADALDKPLHRRGQVRVGDATVDFRVLLLTGVYGESVVVRMLDSRSAQMSFSALGYHPDDLAKFQRQLARPSGLVVCCGPAGSGKTVSLYSALNQLNDDSRKLLTVENPIEIALPGVTQLGSDDWSPEVHEINRRAALSSDPDVIVAGELGDRSTAEFAMRASTMGHMVLGFMHENSAVQALVRMRTLGAESGIGLGAQTCVICQRLARRLCAHCSEPADPGPQEMAWVRAVAEDNLRDPGDMGTDFRRPVGCDRCSGGYHGRAGAYEVLVVNEEIRDVLVGPSSEVDVWHAARANGTTNVLFDLLRKAGNGLTSFAECTRVTGEGPS